MSDHDRPPEDRDLESDLVDDGPHGDAPTQRGVPASFKIGLVLFALAGGVAFLLLNSGAGDALAYSKLVHEVMADPDQFQGRQLRVEGDLRPGSIQFREEPCEWRFVIEKESRQMPVSFPQCVVPDTFREGFGIQVTVQGHLQQDGTFLANEVIPRCPSKYEMQERLEGGEQMPHAAAPPTVGS